MLRSIMLLALLSGAASTSPPAEAAAPPPVVTVPPRPTPAAEAALRKAAGSLYVQCDGQPDNMSGGESAARVLGAITLIGLFAPTPEAADPAKRKLGAEGVAVCSRLIDGAERESSAARRIGLILARGAHRIEAKDYAGAVTDAELARATAREAGLAADPYWAASRGRGADLLEAAALYRQGRVVVASEAALRDQGAIRYALFPLLATPDYYASSPAPTTVETAHREAMNHALPAAAVESADRLEQLGRFADAAALRDAVVDFDRVSAPKTNASLALAQAAVTHALAGNTARAADLAREAQENFDRRKAEGKPDPDPAAVVELLDLYAIVRTAAGGDAKAARRLFAARSQWASASFGSTVEVNRRLRIGAAPDELIGGLAQPPAALWKARGDEELAKALAKDADNKTLYAMFPAAVRAGDYEAVAKGVWKTEKSSWLIKRKQPDPDADGFDLMFRYGTNPLVMSQAYMLHAALLAKARGQQGFVIQPFVAQSIFAARVKTGNPGEPGLPAPLFNDAATVIAALSPIIPDPAALKARRAARDARATR